MFKRASQTQQFLDRSGSYSDRASRRGYDPDAQRWNALNDRQDRIVMRLKAVEIRLMDVNQALRTARRRFAATGAETVGFDNLEQERIHLSQEHQELSVAARAIRRERSIAHMRGPGIVNATFVETAKALLPNETFQYLMRETNLRLQMLTGLPE